MKKFYLLLTSLLLTTAGAWAADTHRPMLQQHKTWYYIYHHFEETGESAPEETMWTVAYTLIGDTVINERQYMKMYRSEYDEHGRTKSHAYYAAYREDDGKVYAVNKEDGTSEHLQIDFSLQYGGEGFEDAEPVEETIKVNGQQYTRYRYRNVRPDGSPYMLGFLGVEGVGFKDYGLVRHVLAPDPNCICDYESFDYVLNDGNFFSNQDFMAPKQIQLSEEQRELVAQNNDFALRLFRQARKEENLLLSPLSVTCALGMLNNGAAGLTQQEICQVLGFGDAGAEGINQFCHKMMTESGELDGQTRVDMANNIFLNKDYVLRPHFVELAQQYYGATPETRDFSDGLTRDAINQWASDHTEGMIREVLSEDDFKPEAVSYLLNALYFKGAWACPFLAANTADEVFGGGDKMPVMWMPFGEFEYMDNDTYQALKLPYGNGAYVMTVLLPREGKTISDVLSVLDGKNWQFRSRMHQTDLKLPRFETEVSVDLKPVMCELGMPRAFDWQQAEFPDFCNRDTYIGLMKQVARIKVDEQGTEAAAVTVIGNETTGMPPHATFHATRPFLYIISEQSTGAIFFVGQFMGNTAAGVETLTQPQRLQSDDAVYNLNGQRVGSTQARGIYIQGGRKIVIK